MATDHFLDRQFYFDGLAKGELLLQRCKACGHVRFPAILICNRCKSKDWGSFPSAGKGSIHSYIIMRRPQLADQISPAVAVVELDERVYVVAPVVGIESDQVTFDTRVEIEFLLSAEGVNTYAFRPV